MTLKDYANKNVTIPEYYSTMYMDGYTPEQILQSARETFSNVDDEEPQSIHITSEVRKK